MSMKFQPLFMHTHTINEGELIIALCLTPPVSGAHTTFPTAVIWDRWCSYIYIIDDTVFVHVSYIWEENDIVMSRNMSYCASNLESF